MSANHRGANKAIPTLEDVTDRYQQVYEQLFTLADTVGAAYADAYQQSRDACTETYQKLAFDVGSLQSKLAEQGPPDWQTMLASATSPDNQAAAAKERTLAIGGDLSELSRTIGLAYLDAGEKAALAAVKAYEKIGAGSPVDVVKTAAPRQASLARQFMEAGTSTARQFAAQTG